MKSYGVKRQEKTDVFIKCCKKKSKFQTPQFSPSLKSQANVDSCFITSYLKNAAVLTQLWVKYGQNQTLG